MGRPSIVSRKICYRYYRKPMATKLVTDFNSAHSMNAKVATLSQDVYRHLSNCSPDTEIAEKCNILESFIDRLIISHYPPKVIKKIITNGIITHRRAEVREAKKERNRHRLGEEGKRERALKKFSLQENWFRKQGKGAVTPGSGPGLGGTAPRRQPMQNNSVRDMVSPRGGPGIGDLAAGLPREAAVSPRGGPGTGLPRETLNTNKSIKPVILSAPVFVPATKDPMLLKNMQGEE